MKPARVLNSDTFEIRAKAVDQDYRIQVALPDGYPGSEDEPYPVIYKLDAELSMGLATDVARALALSGETPKAVVVGIGYPVESFMQTPPMRARDFSLVENNQKTVDHLTELGFNESDLLGQAGAQSFLAFITDELIPTVESRYNTKGSRAVIEGYSGKGAFAAYALLSGAPFDGYVIGSPWFGWEDHAINAVLEESNAELHGKRVFLSVGALERSYQPIEELDDFAEKVRRKWPEVEVKTVEFANETHVSCEAVHMSWGLRWVFSSSD